MKSEKLLAMPELSICIPTFNGRQFIQDAIESILIQSLKNFELIIVDDNSIDDTVQIIKKFKDPRIRLYQNHRQLGLVENWNRCISLSKGNFIQIFHQDDRMSSHSAERVIDNFHSNLDIGFIFSNTIEINEYDQASEVIWNMNILPLNDTIIIGEDLFGSLLSSGNWIPCPGVVVRSECYKKWGVYDKRLKFTPDLEMWLRLSLHENSFFIREPLIFLRRHRNQESHRFIGKTQEIIEVWNAYQIIFTEQSQYISDIEYKYSQAITFLINWSNLQLRWKLKQNKFIEAIKFLKLSWYLEKRKWLRNSISKNNNYS